MAYRAVGFETANWHRQVAPDRTGCEAAPAECWGYTLCQDLYTAQEDRTFPQFMYRDYGDSDVPWNNPDDWTFETCQSFPRPNAIMDKVYVVLGTVVVQMPPTLLFTMLFTLGSTPYLPAFWKRSSKNYKKLMRSTKSTSVELFIYFVLTFLLDTQRLSRAIARYFLVVASVIFKSTAGLRRGLRWLEVAHRRNKQTLRFLWETKVKGRNANWVFQEMEAQEKLLQEQKVAEIATEGTFQVETASMDSLLTQLAIVLLVVGWGALVMYLFVYSVAIRDLMGEQAENTVLGNWAVSLIIDQFGIHVVKTFIIKITVTTIMTKLQERAKGEVGLVTWYEMYISKHLQMHYSVAQEGDEMDTNGAMYDTGMNMVGMDLF
ncbi:hypothetical protein CYMTET_47011 [Cymbomonas tetramitiformis]|uniref:Uncharacterized protein n=1 Tax=Cymbomonas tetramitiformis TaxID=36881 RepID=A0AAE0BV34_9CHLO|nr:hypothetical protein CYMTET_47011 [Cymbomonas tetramitiformis]